MNSFGLQSLTIGLCAKDAEGLVPLSRLFLAGKNRSAAEPVSSLAFRLPLAEGGAQII
jgi:hypothetical protein